jgi:hypothetical protein
MYFERAEQAGKFEKVTFKETVPANTESYFLKGTTKVPMDSAKKALLNRKGNMLLNEGNVEAARRVFITTGYGDGLARVGDYYKKNGRAIDALRMYWVAPDKKKADQVIVELSILIKNMIHED